MARYYSEADYCAEEMARPYDSHCHGEGGERYVVRKEEYEEIDEVERARRGHHHGHGQLGHSDSRRGHLGYGRSYSHGASGHLGHSGSHRHYQKHDLAYPSSHQGAAGGGGGFKPEDSALVMERQGEMMAPWAWSTIGTGTLQRAHRSKRRLMKHRVQGVPRDRARILGCYFKLD